jgi:molecular chaperone Hsp33
MPPVQEEVLDRLIARIRQLPSVTDLLRAGTTPEELLADIFTGIPYTNLGKYALAWQCSCSRERVEKALITLGREEIEKVAVAEETIAITCEFCRSEYSFHREDLQRLAKEIPVVQ